MSTNKRIHLEADQWTLLSGKDKYSVDLPEGEIAVWCQWMCDADVQAWLIFQSGLRAPYFHGRSGHFDVRVKDCVAVELETLKRATLCVCVSCKSMHADDALDYTPVEITPPGPMQLPMSHVVTREVRRQLEAMGVPVHEPLEVDDEDDLEAEDFEGDEFGGEFMEPDPAPAPVADAGKRKSAAGVSVRDEPVPDAGSGDEADPPSPEPTPA